MTDQTTRHTSHGMRTQLVTTAADVISRAMQQGRTVPAALAVALDSARLLQSPDTAAEFEKLVRWHEEDGKAMEVGRQQRRNLRARITELERERHTTNEALSDAAEQLRANRDRIAELESAAGTARAVHVKHTDSEHCQHDGEPWPCPTLAALGPAPEGAVE
ncbi:hypothetical protein ACFVGX_36840 [Streptomyces sp. NPDC127113]|uniref:hypothetical protein n=1 Tax=Streptomyces sp. NPDC127113 TaxID=3345365 RepID=UPI0036447A7F